MTCSIRKWKMSDAADLAAAISNKKVQENLRDGLPYPYAEQDGTAYISAMLSADENETCSFAITAEGNVIGSIGVFRQGNIHRRTETKFSMTLHKKCQNFIVFWFCPER